MVGERIQKLGDNQAQHGLGHSLKHKVPGMRSHRALPRCDRLSAQLWTPATHAHDMSQLGCEPWAGVADRPADGAVCFRFGVVQRLVCWCLHLSQHMPRQNLPISPWNRLFRRCRDSHCGEHLRDHGARHQPPCPPRPQGAAATGARSDAHGRHDLQRVRGCGHDQETSLLLPCAAVPAPDCSSPPTGPLPPPPPQPVRTGGWSVPVGARSRPPTLPTDKEKVGSARKPNSGRDSWHGAGGLCDDPALGHLGCARCGWRQAGDGG